MSPRAFCSLRREVLPTGMTDFYSDNWHFHGLTNGLAPFTTSQTLKISPAAWTTFHSLLHRVNPRQTTNTAPAGRATTVHLRTTPPATRRRGVRGNLMRHIRGASTALFDMLLPRSSRDPIATNPAIDYIAQTTHTLVALVDGVLHELEETNHILRHGAHTTSPQAREEYAGHGDGEEDLHQAGDDDVGDPQTSPAVTRIIYPPSSASDAHPTPGPSITNAPSHKYPGAFPTISTVSSAPAVPPVSPGPATSVNCAMLRREPCERDDLQAAVNGLAATAQGPSDDGDTEQDSHQRFTEEAIRAAQRRAGVGKQQLAFTSQPGSSAQAALPHRSSLAPYLSSSDDSNESSRGDRLLANALNGALGEGDLTRLQFSDTVINNGPFIDCELSIRIGTKAQLGDFALFNAGLEDIIRVCNARRFDLTQLRLEFHQCAVAGGPFDNADALDMIMLSLKSFFHSVRTVSVLFIGPDRMSSFATPLRMISDAFQHLHQLRLAGRTSAARLSSFPLEKLRILEFLADISEADVQALPAFCENLAALTAGPLISSDVNFLRAEDCRDTTYPPIMRISSANPCQQLLNEVSGNEVALQFSVTDADTYNKIYKYFTAKPSWSLYLQ
ncbi:hypothetical protein GGG16DRAFT_129736 [Schizophyllum commune]